MMANFTLLCPVNVLPIVTNRESWTGMPELWRNTIGTELVIFTITEMWEYCAFHWQSFVELILETPLQDFELTLATMVGVEESWRTEEAVVVVAVVAVEGTPGRTDLGRRMETAGHVQCLHLDSRLRHQAGLRNPGCRLCHCLAGRWKKLLGRGREVHRGTGQIHCCRGSIVHKIDLLPDKIHHWPETLTQN